MMKTETLSIDREKCHWVSLRIWGDAVPLDDLGQLLAIEPSIRGSKGERIGGDSHRATYHTNVWVWSYPAPEQVPFENQIAALLDRLEPHRTSLIEFFSTSGAEGELLLGFSSGNSPGGALLTRGLLERVVSFGLAIVLDLYPPVRVEPDG